MDISEIDIAMPTYQSENTIYESLSAAKTSLDKANVSVNKFIVVDNESEDGTISKIEEVTNEFDWESKVFIFECNLPQAREKLIREIDTRWFVFLDDDVIVSPDYFSSLLDAVGPIVGAVQGKKCGNKRPPSQWVHRRSIRGGTHATLIRHSAASGISFPDDLEVLEDEYLRRYIENENGYLWIFNHQAIFDHDNQMRHFPGGWQEGYLAGKYDLRPSYRFFVDLPASIKAGNNPLHQIERGAGFIAGKLFG